MAAKQHLDQLRKQIDKLRSDSLSVVASANKIVYQGVQKLADRELKALNDYYRSALSSIKSANKNDLRGLAGQQLDLLQDTVNQVISHARESMNIVADTRAELAKLVQKGVDGEKVAVKTLNKTVAPAKKAVAKAKSAAQKAAKDAKATVKKAGKDVEKTARKSVQKATGKVQAATSKAVASGKATAAAAVKKVEYAFPAPSPGSRASRATSKAKQAASTAAESVGNMVSSVSSAVAGAVDKVADAIKPQN